MSSDDVMKRKLRPPSCRYKNHYPTKAMAEIARIRLQERHLWLFRVYLCDLCDEWHMARVKVGGKPVPIVVLSGDDES